MEKTSCYTCQKPRPSHQCGLCQEAICKNCAQFLDEDSFSYMTQVPVALSHQTYCNPCFSAQVSPELEAYNEKIDQAKNIIVFDIGQGKETRLMKRSEKPFKVENCVDREDALLRLAFFAVQSGFNALIDVSITSQKIRQGSYQTSQWHGSAIPTQLDKGRYS